MEIKGPAVARANSSIDDCHGYVRRKIIGDRYPKLAFTAIGAALLIYTSTKRNLSIIDKLQCLKTRKICS